MTDLRLVPAFVIAVLALSLVPAVAADLSAAEKAVAAAESDVQKVAVAKDAVAAAITAQPTAVAPRLLEARVLLVEARGKKTAERKAAFARVFETLDAATALDPWDAGPFRLKVDAMTAMGTPDQSGYAEALRAVAIRAPGDAVAREAYVRQKKGVPKLAVGDPMPRVTWTDAKGATVTSDSLWAKGPAIIELYRSAVWCPYCQKQLFTLHDAADAIAASGATLVACSPDTVETLAKIGTEGMKDRKPFKLRLLSDAGGKTADKLGFLNPDTVKPGVRAEAFGLPFPTTIVVDSHGIVQFVKTHGDVRERVKPEEMMAIVRKSVEADAAPKKK
ncbi:MAG TPA: redoxin domain-containing protein [Planctomycetota bacterium]|nr:redoxin domain-containing protein [Planctomycetota bacterium]